MAPKPTSCHSLFLLMLLLISLNVSAQKNRKTASDPVMKLEGKIEQSIYYSPENLFQVQVPRMRNPFIKEPSDILDGMTDDGSGFVEFQVLDLGERYRFGLLTGFGTFSGQDEINPVFEKLLSYWVEPKLIKEIILEEEQLSEKSAGKLRVYLIEESSILFRMVNKKEGYQEEALITVSFFQNENDESLYFALGQFDMENKGGHYTLETENGRNKIAIKRKNDMISLISEFR